MTDCRWMAMLVMVKGWLYLVPLWLGIKGRARRKYNQDKMVREIVITIVLSVRSTMRSNCSCSVASADARACITAWPKISLGYSLSWNCLVNSCMFV